MEDERRRLLGVHVTRGRELGKEDGGLRPGYLISVPFLSHLRILPEQCLTWPGAHSTISKSDFPLIHRATAPSSVLIILTILSYFFLKLKKIKTKLQCFLFPFRPPILLIMHRTLLSFKCMAPISLFYILIYNYPYMYIGADICDIYTYIHR